MKPGVARTLYTVELALVVFAIAPGALFFPPALLSVPALFGLVAAIDSPQSLRAKSLAGVYIHGSAAIGLILLLVLGALSAVGVIPQIGPF